MKRWIIVLLIVAAVAGAVWFFVMRGGGGDEEQGGGRPPEVTIASVPATRATVTRTIEGVADVLALDAVTITAEAGARVAEVNFEQGDTVRRGAVLVRLDSAQEAADVATRRAETAELRGRLERLRRLVAEGAIARGDAEDLERQVQAAEARTTSARTLLEDTVIRAPFAGTIGLRQVSRGAFVQPGTELVTLDRIDRVRLRFTLPENAIGRVRVGAPVEARTSAFGDQVFRGRVSAFAGRLDLGLRTLAAEAELPNPERLLRPGMLAELKVTTETVPGAVVVPPIVLQVRGPIHFVYRIVEGCAIRTEVELGQREPGRVEIVKGLKAGERVATEGFDNLSGGSPVIDKREAAKRARAQQGGEKPNPEETKARGEEARKRCAALSEKLAAEKSGASGR